MGSPKIKIEIKGEAEAHIGGDSKVDEGDPQIDQNLRRKAPRGGAAKPKQVILKVQGLPP